MVRTVTCPRVHVFSHARSPELPTPQLRNPWHVSAFAFTRAFTHVYTHVCMHGYEHVNLPSAHMPLRMTNARMAVQKVKEIKGPSSRKKSFFKKQSTSALCRLCTATVCRHLPLLSRLCVRVRERVCTCTDTRAGIHQIHHSSILMFKGSFIRMSMCMS